MELWAHKGVLSVHRDVGKALSEIPKEYQVENSMLAWDWRKQSKMSSTGPTKSVVLLLGCSKGRAQRLPLEQY